MAKEEFKEEVGIGRDGVNKKVVETKKVDAATGQVVQPPAGKTKKAIWKEEQRAAMKARGETPESEKPLGERYKGKNKVGNLQADVAKLTLLVADLTQKVAELSGDKAAVKERKSK